MFRITKGTAIFLAVVAASQSGCGSSDDNAQNSNASPVTNTAPTEYPAAWNVAYKNEAAIPASYQFGRSTTTLAKGSTYPPATMPLPCNITWDRDVPVTLRDGTTIYTDVLRPAGNDGKLPSIVAWSPYGKTIPSAPEPGVDPANFSGIAKGEGPDAAFWACRGYAVVNPDARGAFKSGGKLHFWGSVDAGDGYDVIEWIAKQSWSNGKVGMHGTSWLSIAQWFIAATKPPHLAAIAPWNGFNDMYRNSIALGGIPNAGFNDLVESGFTGESVYESASAMITNNPLINDYWKDKAANLESITVPAYVTADGVTTLHRTGALEGFRRLGSSQKWLRINNTTEWIDQYTPKYEEDLALFFDHYLTGASNGWENTSKVRISVSDPGHTDPVDVPYTDWPIPSTAYTQLYLNAADGTLNPKAVASVGAATYDANSGQAQFKMAFTNDTQVAGYLKAHLWVEASGNDDMDLFVLVEKLAADGTVLVASPAAAQTYLPVPPPGAPGRLRVSLRALDATLSRPEWPVGSFDTAQKLTAGQIVPVEVQIMPEAMIFHAGEQIRLTVAGKPIKEQLPTPTLNKGNHIVHTGGAYDSYLQVPLVSVAGG